MFAHMLKNVGLTKSLLLASCLVCHGAQAACRQPLLIHPAQKEIADASPRIEWTPAAEVRHYLVWVESRVPEGKVLLAEEFQTAATYLIPPRPLTTGKATVRIRVTAVCKNDTQAALSARFRIDADDGCRLAATPLAESNVGLWKLRWDALPAAQRYEVRVHSTEDGRPFLTRESGKSTLDLGRLEPGTWLLAVQPQCKGLKGASSWVPVTVE